MKSNGHKRRWINRLTPVQLLILFYVIAVFISTVSLALPVAYKSGVEVAFIDVLFTAVSALSVTGLSTVTIVDTFSTTGVILLTVILQLGAVGVMAISTFIWLLIGKKIGLKERRLIMADQNQTSFKGMVRLIKEIMLLLVVIELIAFVLLGTYFLHYYPTMKEASLHGFFGTISAVTNGGFDITGASLIPFRHDYFVQLIVMFLIIFGAIGFPVLIEVKAFITAKREKRRYMRFSLFTKVTTITFFGLIIVGALGMYLLDTRFFSSFSWHEAAFYSIFQSVTTRSGGLSTLDINLLSEANHLFMSFLMFIGASPSSAGGGIRTTTFALVIIFIFSFARGKRNIRIFNREIYEEDVRKAVTVMLVGLLLMFISVLVMTVIEDSTLMQIVFEVTSAFGTVGLSFGITEELHMASKVILMLLMFVGRVGIVTFLFMFQPNKNEANFHYPKEKIIIG